MKQLRKESSSLIVMGPELQPNWTAADKLGQFIMQADAEARD